MSDQLRDDEIKAFVRQGYTDRVQAGSCCGPAAASSAPECGCGAAAAIGYSKADLAGLPANAVANSFGCGNPAAFSDVREGDVVVDVGSGAGIDCLIASRKVGPGGRVIGLDMTPAMIERARENAREAGAANVEFRLGEAEAMPVESASVDWVISNCVINLAPDKAKVFREVARVLKPGGRVAISDIVLAADAPPLPAAIARDPELYVACVAGAIRESDYLAAMRAAGLVDVAVTERMGYDEDALEQFFGETLERMGGGGRLGGFFAELKRAVAGRVWSARIVGRKSVGTAAGVERAVIEPAVDDDAPAIESLLAGAGLPAIGVREGAATFSVARAGARVVGCAGYETYGRTALLRSLAVAPEARGRGIGTRLAREVLDRARRSGATEAVLLTGSVQAMASALGFVPVARESLPAEVTSSWEFKLHCCDSATCMRRSLAE